MIGWGASPWGMAPWGAPSAAAFGLVGVVAIRENMVRLTFNDPVYWSQWCDPFDGASVERYTITAVAGTVDLYGKPVRDVAPSLVERTAAGGGKQVDLWLDRSMSGWGARYVVGCNGLQSVFGMLLDPSLTSATIDGLARGRPAPTLELAASAGDFANPQTLSALLDPLAGVSTDLLGTFPVDSQGDYARDEGLTSVKKRIFRRLTTRKDAFTHLPGYGVLVPGAVKQLARQSLVQTLAADAEAQIKQEPEVVAASVRLVQTGDGLYRYQVKVKTIHGLSFDLTAPAPFSIGA